MLAAQLPAPDAGPMNPISLRAPVLRPGGPDSFEVHYRTKVAMDLTGTIEVEAETPDKAAAKARCIVHREFIPPKCFKAVEVVEVGEAGAV
jgi:hypothetical protein